MVGSMQQIKVLFFGTFLNFFPKYFQPMVIESTDQNLWVQRTYCKLI